MNSPQFLQVFFDIGAKRELIPIHRRNRTKETRYFLTRYPIVRDFPIAIWISPPAPGRPRFQIRPRPVDFLAKGIRPKTSLILLERGQPENRPCEHLPQFNIRCLDEMMKVAERYWSFLSGNPALAGEATVSSKPSFNLLKQSGDRRQKAEDDAICDLMVCYLYPEWVTRGRSLNKCVEILKLAVKTSGGNGEWLRKELQRLRLPGMREARRQLE
ncbi:MAG: hypothetical protein LV479_03145 [Methylacidiphilales bacterium]|nr:hypothetical protein [Candidatus Methylacidiphilales bacterium]